MHPQSGRRRGANGHWLPNQRESRADRAPIPTESVKTGVARPGRVESVFLNIPYDSGFENLYLAYIVGLIQLGLRVNATLAVPNQGRLEKIIGLIEKSEYSLHDLSRFETTKGIPRFNMPVELGLALYRSHDTKGKHRVFVFERKRYRTQRSTSDINGLDPQIHNGSPKGVMAGLRNIFRQPGDATTVPEMLASYRAVGKRLPEIRKNAGGSSLFEASVFKDLTVLALIESQKRIESRRQLH